MAKDKNGREINIGDLVKGRDGRSWKVKRIVGDNLEFELTSAGSFPSSDFILFNSTLNAKFKVGDVVEIIGSRLASKGWVGTVKSVGSGSGWNIKVQFPAGKYSNDYGEYREDELYKVRNSTATKNAVVRNALAWRARNSSFDGKSVKTGKIHKDSPLRGFYQFISDDGIMALDASSDPREAKRIAEKAGFKVHS